MTIDKEEWHGAEIDKIMISDLGTLWQQTIYYLYHENRTLFWAGLHVQIQKYLMKGFWAEKHQSNFNSVDVL